MLSSAARKRAISGGIVGAAAIDLIRQFKVDYAVIGSSAIDAEGALLDFDYREVRVAQAILQNARHSYLVADKSKMERTAPARIGHISLVSDFFTDQLTSPDLAQVCAEHGVRVHETRTSSGA